MISTTLLNGPVLNNRKLNSNKSYEIIVHHSSKKLTFVPPLLEKVSRTHALTVLGVTFDSSLSFSQHMQNVTAEAATSLYALKTLKAHGLQDRALWDVTQATRVAQIKIPMPPASPSWRAFIKAEQIACLNAILLKARRYLSTDFHSLNISAYWIPMTSHFLDLPDIALNMFLHQLFPP